MIVPDKKRLYYFSVLILGGMSAIGIVLIHYLQERDVSDTLTGGKRYYIQTLTGLFFGSLAALLAVALINGEQFKSVRVFLEEMLQEINPSFTNIVFYSFCTAIGEEVLFRAGIQPLIGIWPTAILFVFLHGEISPLSIRLVIYGAFLVIISAGLGYLYKYFGLVSSILSHFVYDVSMLCVLKYSIRKT
ncbi:MAG TPA: CPBP family intramembrane glutamic endopeptidase [Chitinophagales bacterium]|nr:CPBP family intramembrane glutamic endopeptidase [Chitinophagales bacterium]